jgi:hypothetical protein
MDKHGWLGQLCSSLPSKYGTPPKAVGEPNDLDFLFFRDDFPFLTYFLML